MKDTGATLTYTAIALAAIGFPLVALGHIETCVIVDGALPNQDGCTSLSFWDRLAASPPNEIGDTLAGVFGSLAFLAAAIAVFMQSRELSAQREELKLTREEYERQRKATEKMATSLEQQSLVLENERRIRLEDRAHNEFDQLLVSLSEGFKRASDVQWRYAVPAQVNEDRLGLFEDAGFESKTVSLAIEKTDEEPDIDAFIIRASFQLEQRVNRLEHAATHALDFQRKAIKTQREIEFIKQILDKLTNVFKSLSTAQRERFQRLRISPMFFEFQRLMTLDVFMEGDA